MLLLPKLNCGKSKVYQRRYATPRPIKSFEPVILNPWLIKGMIHITWLIPGDFTAIKIEFQDKDKEGKPEETSRAPLILRVNDFITYTGRPEGARIVGFTPKDSDPRGPMGMTYLPWRAAEQRWATPRYSMKGNEHFIICYPVGLPHYGTHIDWRGVEVKVGTPPPDVKN